MKENLDERESLSQINLQDNTPDNILEEKEFSKEQPNMVLSQKRLQEEEEACSPRRKRDESRKLMENL